MKSFLKLVLFMTTLFGVCAVCVSKAQAETVIVEGNSSFGTVRGVVRDEAGSAIANATVAFFRVGTTQLLKQVRSASDGRFLMRIMAGSYTVLAVAEGYNPVTLPIVNVEKSTQLNYGFNLQRVGSGKTLPEKRLDRNSSKWRIRAAQTTRSIYQSVEGEPTTANAANQDSESKTNDDSNENADEQNIRSRLGQTVVESFVSNSANGNSAGLNFARLQPLTKGSEVVLIGQVGSQNGEITGLNRFQANLKIRPNDKNQIYINGSVANLGKIRQSNHDEDLGQISLQALNELKVGRGVVIVFGFDYSRFFGAGNDSSISPRLGFQFDLNPRTRFRTSYTTQNEQQTWQNAIDMEGTQINFREPTAIQDIALENAAPIMNKSTRFEFGVERILDSRSTIEAVFFFDTIFNRGIGLTAVPFGFADGETNEFTANQQGGANGLRVVISRRFNGKLSATAGYALGNGQKLSEEGITNPANLFAHDFFQTFFGQFDAMLGTGTEIRTIFRFSPSATVFAIDPFQGRLAIYDPNLSIIVTQPLPTLGLPIRAKAILDARNIFDSQGMIAGEEGSLRINSRGRTLRGTISVRF